MNAGTGLQRTPTFMPQTHFNQPCTRFAYDERNVRIPSYPYYRHNGPPGQPRIRPQMMRHNVQAQNYFEPRPRFHYGGSFPRRMPYPSDSCGYQHGSISERSQNHSKVFTHSNLGFTQQNSRYHRGGHCKNKSTPKSSTSKKTEKAKGKTFPFNCEICDRGFKTEEKYKEHCDGHETCKIDGCSYTAAPKLVKLHFEFQHRTGLAKKIWQLESKEDIAKWIAERKKNYPTKENVERKKKEMAERIERGEVIETRQFGKMRGRGRGRGRGMDRGRGSYTGHSSRSDGRTESQPHTDNGPDEQPDGPRHHEGRTKKNRHRRQRKRKCPKDGDRDGDEETDIAPCKVQKVDDEIIENLKSGGETKNQESGSCKESGHNNAESISCKESGHNNAESGSCKESGHNNTESGNCKESGHNNTESGSCKGFGDKPKLCGIAKSRGEERARDPDLNPLDYVIADGFGTDSSGEEENSDQKPDVTPAVTHPSVNNGASGTAEQPVAVGALGSLMGSYASSSECESESESDLEVKKPRSGAVVINAGVGESDVQCRADDRRDNASAAVQCSQTEMPRSVCDQDKMQTKRGESLPKQDVNKQCSRPKEERQNTGRNQKQNRKSQNARALTPSRTPTLLQKLLANEIRHERNVIMQCIRHIVKSQFFGVDSKSSVGDENGNELEKLQTASFKNLNASISTE